MTDDEPQSPPTRRRRPQPGECDAAPDGETAAEFFDRMTRLVDESRRSNSPRTGLNEPSNDEGPQH